MCIRDSTVNALKENSVAVNSNSLTISVPSLSTTAILLHTTTTGLLEHKTNPDGINIFPNPATNQLKVRISTNVAEPTEITVYNQGGKILQSSIINYDGFSPITVNLSTLSN